MEYKDILNKWARYTEYDSDQRSFMLGSLNYEWHLVGKNIQKLLEEFDPSGLLAVIYAKYSFKKVLREFRPSMSLWDLVQNLDMFAEEREICRMFEDAGVKEAENKFLRELNHIYLKASGENLIGSFKEDDDSLMSYLDGVVKDIGNCHLDVFQKGAPVGQIENVCTSIQVFEKLLDAIVALDGAKDGMYLCFINAGGTSECWFGFFIKDHGNLFCISDRCDEAYIGQHKVTNRRNGRIQAEAKACGLFPYNFIRCIPL